MRRDAITTTQGPVDSPTDEKTIEEQRESNDAMLDGEDSPQPDNEERLKSEQPLFPDNAEVKRGYAKWTDNSGQFHKYPIDGTTAIREPAHEQHDLDVEDRQGLDQALAGKTPRRDNDAAVAAMRELHEKNLVNDQVADGLVKEGVPVEPEEPEFDLEEGSTQDDAAREVFEDVGKND